MEAPPPVKARFFYTSPLAIDDPLSPVPPPTISTAASSKLPPRPFSEYDNARLDEAWRELRKNIAKCNEERGKAQTEDSSLGIPLAQGRSDTLKTTYGSPLSNGSLGQRTEGSSWGSTGTQRRIPKELDGSPRSSNDAARNDSVRSRSDARSTEPGDSSVLGVDSLLSAESELPATTGTPFIRAPSRLNVRDEARARDKSASRPRPQVQDSYKWDDGQGMEELAGQVRESKQEESRGPSTKVPTGVSRLHQVSMPDLNLEPIYWAPVNDVAPVVRATWFYRDTMMPVEVSVANMLELGYIEWQVWTQTWQDELNSAIEVGAAGEERILRKLWPHLPNKAAESRPGTSRGDAASLIQNLVQDEPDTPEAHREKATEEACKTIDACVGSSGLDNRSSGTVTFGRNGLLRSYATAGVIYENATTAHILKPSLQPSSYYGRRPLASYIRKGRKLGVPVVRGFDQTAWDKLYPQPKSTKSAKAYAGASTSEEGATAQTRKSKDPELAPAVTPKVTDLVLVIHGIGQKLSERMESYHFTHAMNGFRREVNVELGTDSVRSRLRPDAGGIMVLPVNWRHKLSFEEGGYRAETDDPLDNQYSLKDITPDSLPSVRGIVSDVMLDIPYYLSHHQPKMIAAVIREANRIYKLWCSNNPDFATEGRVHIIAHSLGSVMAMDILSVQPSTLPSALRDPVTANTDNLQHFAFNVSNLFCAGSPAGFFLLLKRAPLRPRIDRPKPGADEDAFTNTICGRQGDYGCIAVDNLYNVINPYDPVSYRMNAAVDKTYAAGLKPAWLPSATPGWFSSYTSSASAADNASNAGWFGSSKPRVAAAQSKSSILPSTMPLSNQSEGQEPGNLPRLPSNVELETHDFSREETAEKRMFLLNDAGQIDFLIKYGGGPLEIQYLTMLSAHSSYWLLRDFVRMVVVECGRRSGREGVARGMRAAKRKAL